MAVFQPPPPSVEPTPRRVRVRLADRVVADSTRAQLLIECGREGFPPYFVPLEDVRPGVLVDETDTGWSVVAGGRRAERGAWTNEAFGELKGHVTFSWETLDWFEE